MIAGFSCARMRARRIATADAAIAALAAMCAIFACAPSWAQNARLVATELPKWANAVRQSGAKID